MNIGIIGSAGRKDDADKVSKELYNWAGSEILTIIKAYLPQDITLVSGGAALIDFLAVSISLRYNFKLKLHLPAEFDVLRASFIPLTDSVFDPATVAIFYHQQFSKILGRDSLLEMAAAIEDGTKIIVTPGFKERNTKVAADSDILIAATFGNNERLKAGGSLDTFNKHIKLKPNNTRYHINLNNKLIYKL